MNRRGAATTDADAGQPSIGRHLDHDLAKLRGKGLVTRLDGTQRYQLSAEGYRIAVLYQKLYHKLYAPLTAAMVDHVCEDDTIAKRRKTKLDRTYEKVDDALHELSHQVGLVEAAA